VNNVNDVISAGAERVAVVRALMEAEQPTLTQYSLSQMTRIQSPGTLKQPMSSLMSNQLLGELVDPYLLVSIPVTC